MHIRDLPFNKSFFDSMDLGNTTCLKNKTFFWDGFPDEYKFSWLQILVYPCNNLTSNMMVVFGKTRCSQTAKIDGKDSVIHLEYILNLWLLILTLLC